MAPEAHLFGMSLCQWHLPSELEHCCRGSQGPWALLKARAFQCCGYHQAISVGLLYCCPTASVLRGISKDTKSWSVACAAHSQKARVSDTFSWILNPVSEKSPQPALLLPPQMLQVLLPSSLAREVEKQVYHHLLLLLLLLFNRKERERSLSLMLLFPVSPAGPPFVNMPTGNKVQNQI